MKVDDGAIEMRSDAPDAIEADDDDDPKEAFENGEIPLDGLFLPQASESFSVSVSVCPIPSKSSPPATRETAVTFCSLLNSTTSSKLLLSSSPPANFTFFRAREWSSSSSLSGPRSHRGVDGSLLALPDRRRENEEPSSSSMPAELGVDAERRDLRDGRTISPDFFRIIFVVGRGMKWE